MEESNRYPLMGTIVEIGEVKQFSQWLRKREFKIRFTDTDFANKVQNRVVKLTTINDHNSLLDSCRVDDLVKLMYYIEGRDYVKDGKTINFTSLICYEIDIITSNSRDTQEDKNAVITEIGKMYKDPVKEATDEELAGFMVEKDPLVQFPEGPGSEKKIENNTQIDDLPF
jgi:hypothetical protein